MQFCSNILKGNVTIYSHLHKSRSFSYFCRSTLKLCNTYVKKIRIHIPLLKFYVIVDLYQSYQCNAAEKSYKLACSLILCFQVTFSNHLTFSISDIQRGQIIAACERCVLLWMGVLLMSCSAPCVTFITFRKVITEALLTIIAKRQMKDIDEVIEGLASVELLHSCEVLLMK